MTVEQLKDVFLSKGKQKPFVLMRKHCQPVLMPMDLSDAVIPESCDKALYAERAKTIQAHKAFLKNVAAASLLAKQTQSVAAPGLLPELMIDKEVAPQIKAQIVLWMQEFNEAETWHDRAVLLGNYYTRFKTELEEDPSLSRFVKFAGRIVYEHAPEELSAEKQATMKNYIAARILNPDAKVSYMTIAKARKELAQIEKERSKGSPKWAEVTDTQIRSLKLYYTAIEKECQTPDAAPPVNDNAAAPKLSDAHKKAGGPKS